MSEIAEITATAVESLIIVMLCNRFLCLKSNKLQRTKKILFFLLLFIKTLLFDQIKDTEFISAILMTFLILGYAIFILDGKIYEKILLALFPLITIMLINQSIIYGVSRFAGYPVAGLTQAGAEMRIPILFFSKLIFFFACEIFIRLQRHGKYSLTSFQWIVQLSCLLITFLIALFLWNMSKENHALRKDFFYIHMMLILFNILLYILLSKMQSDSMIREEYRISKITLAAQEKFVKEAQERYMETRTLHHDMRHYLMTAAKLIDSGNIQEAEDYIEKIINEKVSPAAAGVNTGDVVIDAVINSKIAYCSKNNIEIKCLVDTHLEDISDIDLSILLANALDNAITGCAGVDMPQIELVIGTRKTMTYIIVKNSIAESVLSENPELRTNKKDKKAHGFGIASMKKIAEKYGGNVEYREEDHFFVTEIWILNSKPRFPSKRESVYKSGI